jgi:hypothetical protein
MVVAQGRMMVGGDANGTVESVDSPKQPLSENTIALAQRLTALSLSRRAKDKPIRVLQLHSQFRSYSQGTPNLRSMRHARKIQDKYCENL